MELFTIVNSIVITSFARRVNRLGGSCRRLFSAGARARQSGRAIDAAPAGK
jgi:hypothetical protein